MTTHTATKRDGRILVLLIILGIITTLDSGQGVTGDRLEQGLDYLVWEQGRLVISREKGDNDDAVPPYSAPFLFKKIPVNEADIPLLCTIRGIGPYLASRIVEERTRGGRFTNGADLTRVVGIGEVRARILKEYFRFD